jgi:hypothetical protein
MRGGLVNSFTSDGVSRSLSIAPVLRTFPVGKGMQLNA